MAWSIEFSDEAERDFAKLTKQSSVASSNISMSVLPLPQTLVLTEITPAELFGLWRYRVGDYRILRRLEDHRLTVLVVEIVHRSKAYD